MSTPSTARPKRSRSTAAAAPKTSSRAPARPDRHELISQHAYRRAEGRGFQGGDPVADWLESEKEVDALLRQNG